MSQREGQRWPRPRADHDSAEADLINAIRAVRLGKSFFSPAVSKTLLEDYIRQLRDRGQEDSYELLSSREREILQLIAEGRANKQIAVELCISIKTVEKHRQQVMNKLNIHDVAGLTRHAIAKGIIESNVGLRAV